METYVTLVESGCQVKAHLFSLFFWVKRVTQLALQEINLMSQFNFNLVSPNIITNKTLEESALPGNFVSNHTYLSHLPQLFALVI